MSSGYQNRNLTRREFLHRITLAGGLALAAACTQAPPAAPNPTAPSAKPTAAQLATAPAVGKETVVHFWHIFTDEKGRAAYDEVVANFQKANPNISVKVNLVATEPYKTMIRSAVSSPDGPDVFYIWPGGSYLDPMAEAGAVLDLTPYITEFGWDKTINKFALEQVKYKGRLYGVPNNLEKNQMWYNVKLFKDHGLEPPKTWEEFDSVAQDLKKKGIHPVVLGNKERWTAGHFATAMLGLYAGRKYIAEVAAEGKDRYDNQKFVSALNHIQELIRKGHYAPGINAMDNAEAEILFFTGKAAMHFALATGEVRSMLTNAPTFQLDFFNLPPVSKDQPYTVCGGVTGTWAVAKNTRNPEATLKFLGYLMDVDAQKIIVKAAGRISPVTAAVTPETIHPILAKVTDDIGKVPDMTKWIEYYMSPAVNDAWLNGLQGVVDLSTPAEKFLAQLENIRQEDAKKPKS